MPRDPEEVERLEFNTRGMMISATGPVRPTVSDLARLVNRQLAIWPSGQIYVEE